MASRVFPVSDAGLHIEDADSNRQRRSDTLDEDITALKCAQKELRAAYEALEQLLGVMRKADDKQLQELFAATQRGLPQAEILAMVKQYAKDNEGPAAK